MAWVYGSILRAHLNPYVTKTPFSVENLSVGNPLIYHCLAFAAPAMKLEKSKPDVWGTFSAWISDIQLEIKSFLYSDGNGPQ